MSRTFYLIPMALVAVVIGLLALSLNRDGGSRFKPSQMVGQEAPRLDLPGLFPEKKRLTIADDFEGWTAVNFFASWCVPCRAEHHVLLQLAKLDNVRLIGIAYKDDPAAAIAFLQELGNPFAETGSDMDGHAAIGFGITGVPETFFIDRKGVIRHHFAGPLTEQSLDGEIATILAEAK